MSERDEELSKIFEAAMRALEDEQEQFWAGLSKEDQLKAFCAVSRRIFKGEIEVRGTYRYVLYDVFGFGREAYSQAQDAGYLGIHNAIVDEGYDGRLLRAFCEKYKIEDAESKVLGMFL
jgi:hypothetical protein